MRQLFSPLLMAVSLAALPPQTNSLQIGERLPCMRGELMTGEPGTLPDLASDHCTLLVMGFATDAKDFAQEWARRFRVTWSDNPRATVYMIPVLGGIKQRLAKGIIERRIRDCTPAALRAHVMTVWGALDEWKVRVDYRAPEDAYLVLLDGDGRVAWRHAGPCEEAAWQALDRVMHRILNRDAAGSPETVPPVAALDSITPRYTPSGSPISHESFPTVADWLAVRSATSTAGLGSTNGRDR